LQHEHHVADGICVRDGDKPSDHVPVVVDFGV